MISINNLTMHYGAKLLFHEVNLNLTSGHRYGIVGANGTGKSTFLRLISGDEEPVDGTITIPKRTTVGLLKQDQFRYENNLVIDVVIQGKQLLWQALTEKEQLLQQDLNDPNIGYRLGELEEIISDQDGYTAASLAQELLSGLGIKEKYHFGPLSALSGGFKLRCLLAQTLFINPDILLLDEPTNHLDIVTISWLEKYLKNQYKGILVFISHDRSFLNNMASKILDIDYGEIREYTGNYNKFLQEKTAVIEQKMHERNYTEKKIAKMQAFVDKFRYGTRSRQSLSREKLIDKIELPDIEKSSRISPYFNFKQKRPSGKEVLKVAGLTKSFGEQMVLKNINFSINKGEKLLFIGPNGIGKSTLLKLITSNLVADSGNFEWGHNTQISYFAQDHHELLNKNITMFDWISEYASKETSSHIRSMLGQALFSKDEINKDIMSLSGGEAARLLFVKIILEQSNVLIFDEPTNHLDVEATDALIKSLGEYEGTLLFVTHDRYVASKLATRIIAITPKSIKDYAGTYDEYMEHYGDDYLSLTWLKANK